MAYIKDKNEGLLLLLLLLFLNNNNQKNNKLRNKLLSKIHNI
jgi:hypothetical protein